MQAWRAFEGDRAEGVCYPCRRNKAGAQGIAEVATVYTRWIESVHVRGKDRNVFVTLAPRFKRLWTEAKKRFPNYVLKTPPTTQATPLKILAPVNGVDAFR